MMNNHYRLRDLSTEPALGNGRGLRVLHEGNSSCLEIGAISCSEYAEDSSWGDNSGAPLEEEAPVRDSGRFLPVTERLIPDRQKSLGEPAVRLMQSGLKPTADDRLIAAPLPISFGIPEQPGEEGQRAYGVPSEAEVELDKAGHREVHTRRRARLERTKRSALRTLPHGTPQRSGSSRLVHIGSADGDGSSGGGGNGGGGNDDCSKPNNMPVGGCRDWITGPASANPTLKMYWWEKKSGLRGKWTKGILHETDQGWLVMSPNEKNLELVAYGDTYVKNLSYLTAYQKWLTPAICKQIAVNFCKLPAYAESCKKLSEAEFCEYCYELIYWGDPKEGRGIPEFSRFNNVVFFDAKIDINSPYHIKFGEHLNSKVIVKNSIEDLYKGKPQPTGNYTLDYFYVCPGNVSDCEDGQKILYFPTSTVYWSLRGQLTDQKNTLIPEMKYIALTRSGMGFYRFGPLYGRSSAKYDNSNGCRVPFAPANSTTPLDYHTCPWVPTRNIPPKHMHFVTSFGKVERTSNPNVIWGLGSKFSQAIVAHGFNDPYHSGPKSNEYVYFVGSGEFESYEDSSTKSYKPTGNIYLARLLASETALQSAQFEYYTGMARGVSLWGTYENAQPILTAPGIVGSYTKRFGQYYMSASCGMDKVYQGMCVMRSEDGFTWKDPDIAYYTIAQSGGSMPSNLVYGHAWVPEAVYQDDNRIPYVFSVWKSIDGYFHDFWFPNGKKKPIKPEHRFLAYNTKMYLYKPKPK